jgi:hypothetical protein
MTRKKRPLSAQPLKLAMFRVLWVLVLHILLVDGDPCAGSGNTTSPHGGPGPGQCVVCKIVVCFVELAQNSSLPPRNISNDINNTLCTTLLPPGPSFEDSCCRFLVRYGDMLQRDILRGKRIQEQWCKEEPHDPCNSDSKQRWSPKKWCAFKGAILRGSPQGNCQGDQLLRRIDRDNMLDYNCEEQ